MDGRQPRPSKKVKERIPAPTRLVVHFFPVATCLAVFVRPTAAATVSACNKSLEGTSTSPSTNLLSFAAGVGQVDQSLAQAAQAAASSQLIASSTSSSPPNQVRLNSFPILKYCGSCTDTCSAEICRPGHYRTLLVPMSQNSFCALFSPTV